jgi:hypothetical protein
MVLGGCDDKLSEDLNNPLMIKEILIDPLMMTLLTPKNLLDSLKKFLSEAFSTAPTQVSLDAIAWLIHSLRVFYSLLV